MAVELPLPGVLLDARDCALIDAALRRGLAEGAVRNGGRSAGVEQVAGMIHARALAYRSQCSPGQVSAQPSVPGAELPAECSVSEAAERLGMAPSSVRRLAGGGRLSARRTARGTWAIDTGHVAVLAQQRTAQRAA